MRTPPEAKTSHRSGEICTATREGSVYIRTCYQFYPINGYQCFQPVDSVLEKVRMILPQDCSDLIGIHIRRTDLTESISRTTQQGMVDALVDLVCLSRTPKIFGSYWSSFSETAAALGETELIVLQNPK